MKTSPLKRMKAHILDTLEKSALHSVLIHDCVMSMNLKQARAFSRFLSNMLVAVTEPRDNEYSHSTRCRLLRQHIEEGKGL